MTDQAAALRRMVSASQAPAAPPLRMARAGATAIAVTSGKGGVGKSNLAVNLALLLARDGDRVALVDADLGLANADVLCGVQPMATLEQCLAVRTPLAECAVAAPGGFFLVPGASGVARLADLEASDRAWLVQQVGLLASQTDWLVIDTGAGLGANTVAFAAAADRILVVSTPEPTSMTDAYGMIKTLAPRVGPEAIEVVVNQAHDEEEARAVFARLDRVSRAFLGRPLTAAGWIPLDPSLPQAVRRRVPVSLHAPGSPSARAMARVAARLRDPRHGAAVPAPRGAAQKPQGNGFLRRLSALVLGAPTPAASAGARSGFGT